MSRYFLKAVALASTVMMAGTANAATLYTQAYDGLGSFFASQNDTNSGGFGSIGTVYDNFTLVSASTITGVSFTGGYFNGSPAAISQFTVKFYANNAGQPGSVLSTVGIVGNGSESGCSAVTTGTVCSYNVSVNFAAAAGTQYWMSIVPDIGFPPQWGWASGTGGDGQSVQDFLGTRSVLPNDMAFTLTGTVNAPAVPEPATWAMMIAGFGLVGGAMRRRQTVASRIRFA